MRRFNICAERGMGRTRRYNKYSPLTLDGHGVPCGVQSGRMILHHQGRAAEHDDGDPSSRTFMPSRRLCFKHQEKKNPQSGTTHAFACPLQSKKERK